ncbi:PIG-X-domain-containing protein [Aspergillus violaceofuscus CBS 115571]|uniref:Protein PBN1 n=1 Tax=Aspergillus violaceofuscus (strain CBS 115571) TaxID=1450538 RepID=A0A2V5I6P1_ASPV1|nr:PIG-X-domain-containing protein [Aspergillus violaceofuscus CBS 115571]
MVPPVNRRTTYLQDPSTPFDPSQARLLPQRLEIRNLHSAKQERLTVPVELLLSGTDDGGWDAERFSVRWASLRSGSGAGDAAAGAGGAVTPFASRVSGGLHVFLRPGGGQEGEGVRSDAVCRVLKKVFGSEVAKCVDYEKSFTRSDTSSEYQFYSPLASLEGFVDFVREKGCALDTAREEPCRRHARELLAADSLDLAYDADSRNLVVSAIWADAPGGEGWTEDLHAPAAGSKGKMEVGLLGAERTADPEEIKMGGLLGVVGEDEKLKPTLFSFASRHHALPRDATFSVEFPLPTGLHPTMAISLSPAALQPPDATCALHTYLTLPSYLFGDKYQLGTEDPLFLDSHHLVKLLSVTGETDLEAPDWSVSQWGSNWLLELATPPDDQYPEEWNVTIPLHLRYLAPSESGYRSVGVPWPVVFWACAASEEAKMHFNPFDRVDLGWEGLFAPQTIFYQVNPAAEQGRLVEEISVPVLKETGFFNSKTIELGTVLAIVLGSLWVLWKLGAVMRTSGTRRSVESQKKSQ